MLKKSQLSHFTCQRNTRENVYTGTKVKRAVRKGAKGKADKRKAAKGKALKERR